MSISKGTPKEERHSRRGPLRREWASAYRNCEEEEEGYWLAVEGRLPADLQGTLYRCRANI